MTGSTAAICSRPTLEGFTEHPSGLGDALLVAAVEGPLLDAFGLDEAEPGENLEVPVGARLGHPQLAGDEDAADPVSDQVAVHLGREVGAGLLQPVEDGEAPVARERGRQVAGNHLDSFLST